MQLRLAALIVTYVIAITAVFVIWPAVGTAPWEDDAPVTGMDSIECREAIDMLARLMGNRQSSSVGRRVLADFGVEYEDRPFSSPWNQAFAVVRDEVGLYCEPI